MNPDIHQTDRHPVFFRKVTAVTCIFEHLAVAVYRFPVKKPAPKEAEGKNQQKKEIGIKLIGMTKAVINLIIPGNPPHGENAHRFIHKVKDKKPKKSKGKSAVIQIIALMPCLGTRKNRRDNKAQQKTEGQRKYNTLGF